MLLVKFVPLNPVEKREYTLSNISNKQVKLSTPYQMNDTFEFQPIKDYLSPQYGARYYSLDGSWASEIKIAAKWCVDNPEPLKRAMSHYSCLLRDKWYLFRDFCENINKQQLHIDHFLSSWLESRYETDNDSFLSFLCEVVIMRRTRILCLSSLDVFNNGNASSMFGHYAGKSDGLALIYAWNKDVDSGAFDKVSYHKHRLDDMDVKPCDVLSRPSTAIQFMKDDLHRKASNWESECEYRHIYNFNLSDKVPVGSNYITKSDVLLLSAESCALELKAILYTPQQVRSEILDELEEINKNYYDEKLHILNCAPYFADCGYKYQVISKKRLEGGVVDYLKNAFSHEVEVVQ